ncbi:MAG: hypothetical protein HY084_09085 [Gemmatimonadetes bacterium]|nr:hypothetical protein [Gemmatimonadota bacterium]
MTRALSIIALACLTACTPVPFHRPWVVPTCPDVAWRHELPDAEFRTDARAPQTIRGIVVLTAAGWSYTPMASVSLDGKRVGLEKDTPPDSTFRFEHVPVGLHVLEIRNCVFRTKPITDFGRRRSPISEQADHPFRTKPITVSVDADHGFGPSRS